MSGTFRHVWSYFGSDLWEPLAQSAGGEAAAPASVFGDLYDLVSEYLSPQPTDASREEASNDPELAHELFLALRGTDFASEYATVRYLEQVYHLIDDYEIPGYADRYARLMERALEKYNLRYRVEEPFELRFLLPGSFSNLYDELYRQHAANTHLAGLLTEFEQAFDGYLRRNSMTNLTNCIAKASHYVEGVVSAANGSPGTLGAMCDQLTVWPHTKIKESLKNIYGFCSDYPGIRHAGDPEGVQRQLEPRDATLASLLLLSFSGYLSAGVDAQAVLGA